MLVILEESEFSVDGVYDGVWGGGEEGSVWLVVLLCLGLGTVRSLAVVLTAGELAVSTARDWCLDVCLRCVCVVCSEVLHWGAGAGSGRGWIVALLVLINQKNKFYTNMTKNDEPPSSSMIGYSNYTYFVIIKVSSL